MTAEVQRKGRRAEERALRLAQQIGPARLATREEDFGRKIDLVFGPNKTPVQISVSLKSKRQRKLLLKRGIVNVFAGDQCSDQEILDQFREILHESSSGR